MRVGICARTRNQKAQRARLVLRRSRGMLGPSATYRSLARGISGLPASPSGAFRGGIRLRLQGRRVRWVLAILLVQAKASQEEGCAGPCSSALGRPRAAPLRLRPLTRGTGKQPTPVTPCRCAAASCRLMCSEGRGSRSPRLPSDSNRRPSFVDCVGSPTAPAVPAPASPVPAARLRPGGSGGARARSPCAPSLVVALAPVSARCALGSCGASSSPRPVLVFRLSRGPSDRRPRRSVVCSGHAGRPCRHAFSRCLRPPGGLWFVGHATGKAGSSCGALAAPACRCAGTSLRAAAPPAGICVVVGALRGGFRFPGASSLLSRPRPPASRFLGGRTLWSPRSTLPAFVAFIRPPAPFCRLARPAAPAFAVAGSARPSVCLRPAVWAARRSAG